jgi:hypothetical protein
MPDRVVTVLISASYCGALVFLLAAAFAATGNLPWAWPCFWTSGGLFTLGTALVSADGR